MRVPNSVELSGLIALYGRQFLWSREPIADAGVQQYWTTSKMRLDRWLATLGSAGIAGDAQWQRVRPVVEEILVTELLTRLWTAVACEYDRRHRASYISPVVRSTLLGHLQARSEALRILETAGECEFDGALDTNRLRSRSERWTDLLLAYLLPDCNLTGCAFDSRRVCDFSEDLPDVEDSRGVDGNRAILQAALQSAFSPYQHRSLVNADLNSRIVCGVAACFRPEQYRTNNRSRSTWMQRMLYAADDTQAMINEFLLEEQC